MNQRGQYGDVPQESRLDKPQPLAPQSGAAFFKASLPVVLVGVGLMGTAVVAIMKHGTT